MLLFSVVFVSRVLKVFILLVFCELDFIMNIIYIENFVRLGLIFVV